MMWIVAIASMCVILVAHHLGFIGKVYAIIGEIARCPMCSVFWGTGVILLYYDCNISEVIALSFAMAYLSNWVAILLDMLSKANDRLWQKSRALWKKKR
jgi:hypothetical protein